MSELTTALERIATWYWENKPESHPVFQPGLARDSINQLLKDFRFAVPDEIYELYEWCNGSSRQSRQGIVFNQYRLLPLEEVASLRQDKYGLNQGESHIPDDPAWFPVFELWSTYAFYIVVFGDKEKSPVRNYDPECESYDIYYENLTNLLLHSAEWIESAQYCENISGWEVERRIDARLQVKYRFRESIHRDDLKWAEYE